MTTCCSPALKIDKKEGCMSRSDASSKNWLILALLSVLLIVGLGYAIQHLRSVHAEATTTDGLGELRTRLLADPSSVSGNWLRTLNPLVKTVQGDVVWNSAQQQGVMRFIDLPKPKAGTFYQLWLYDARGSSSEPVSGGIVTQGAGDNELLALIESPQVVNEPYKFEFKLHLAPQTTDGKVLLMMQP
ncbi:MAG: hypothetical protein RL122_329 [Pseudomonadota bacterium]